MYNEIQIVKQWGRFEQCVVNAEVLSDPYSVELHFTLISPSGQEIKFWGFYDGDCRWVIRFMPWECGRWEYSAHFDAGTIIAQGEFLCEPTPGGMIGRDVQNAQWFGWSTGEHFFMRSFHVGDRFFAEQFTKEQRIEVLDWLQENGYNTLSVASFFINRQTVGRGMEWATPQLWPLNAKEYQKAEAILDELLKREIVVFPFAGFFGREGFNPTAHRDQVRYIKYVVARFGVYRNLLFNVAGPEPILDCNPFMPRSEVDRLGHLIRHYNIYHHLITVHNQTGNNQFADALYTDFVTLQGPKTVDRTDMYKQLIHNRQADMPLYAQETLWTHNIYGHPDYSLEDVRKNAWVIFMSGASFNYGDMQGDSSSGYSGTLDPSLRHDDFHAAIKNVWDFAESIAYYTMQPKSDCVSRGWCLGEDGKRYLIYMEFPGSTELSLTDGSYEGWLIQGDNYANRIALSSLHAHSIIETPPQGDWLIYINRKNV